MTLEQKPNLTLGEFLRQERERRSFTLDQVSSETKIAIRVLQYLESDDYQHLPAKPFIRGFVISYARFLELNPREVLLQFKTFIDQKCSDRPDRGRGLSGYVFERKDGEHNQQLMLWLILAAFVIVGGIVLAIVKPTLKHRRGHGDKLKQQQVIKPSPSPSPSLSVSPVSSTLGAVVATAHPGPLVSPRSSPSSAPSVSPLSSPSPLASDKPDPLNSGVNLKPSEIVYKVIFKALDDVWVRYSVDSRPTMKFILKKDKVLVLRAVQSLRFQASHPDRLTYNYNSRGAKPFQEAKSLVNFPSGDTLFLSEGASEKSNDPFLDQSPLPKF